LVHGEKTKKKKVVTLRTTIYKHQQEVHLSSQRGGSPSCTEKNHD